MQRGWARAAHGPRRIPSSVMGTHPSDDPQPSRDSEPASHGERDERREERCGRVAIARHVKADGRALILYTHAGDGGG
jgi:hypothetical protein